MVQHRGRLGGLLACCYRVAAQAVLTSRVVFPAGKFAVAERIQSIPTTQASFW